MPQPIKYSSLFDNIKDNHNLDFQPGYNGCRSNNRPGLIRIDMTEHGNLADLIVDAALEIADRESWAALALGDIADQLQVPIADVYAIYSDLDEVANAWVKRADISMIEGASTAAGDGLPMEQRLHLAIMCWLGALQGRRNVMRDILIYKIKPPHFHLQAQFVVATSQRIQMLRDAARLRDTGLSKTAGEIGLTLLFTGTVLVWLTDSGETSQRTSDYLKKRLQFGGSIILGNL